jgi:site-specific DNA recombinase
VHRLLRNPLYVGKVRHNDDLFLGEHESIIDRGVFERVQRTLDLRATGTGARRPRRSESLLTGLLRCMPCDAAMSTSHAYNHKKQRYRYYRCRASQEGLRCPTGLLNANDVEAAVVAQVKALAKSGALRDRILATLAEGDEGETELLATKDRLEARITEVGVEAKRLLGAFTSPPAPWSSVDSVQHAGLRPLRISSVDAGGRLLAERLGELERETDKHRAGVADLERRLRACAALRTEGEHVAKLLDAFDEVWEALVTEERREVLRALIARVGVDPESGTLRVTFHEPAPPSNPQPPMEATP